MKRFLLVAAALLLAPLAAARAQDIPTAYRMGQTQVGIAYTNAATDEFSDRIGGVSIYGTFDFLPHIGAQANAHILKLQNPQQYTQSSYEAGLRYFRGYGRFKPYVGIQIGIANSYQPTPPGGLVQEAIGNFAMFSGNGGVDYYLPHNLNIRGDFEYQDWFNYPPHVLNPSMFSIGVAYRIR